jgi:hypothetical protein
MSVSSCQVPVSTDHFGISAAVEQKPVAPQLKDPRVPKIALKQLARDWYNYDKIVHLRLNRMYNKLGYTFTAQQIDGNLFLGSITVANALRRSTAKLEWNSGKKTLSSVGSGESAERFSIVACLDKSSEVEMEGEEKGNLDLRKIQMFRSICFT